MGDSRRIYRGQKSALPDGGIISAASASLTWEVLSTEPWRWFSGASGIWVLVVFLSSLSNSLWARHHEEKVRSRASVRIMMQAGKQKQDIADIQGLLGDAMQIVIQKFFQRFHKLGLRT